MPIIIQYVLGVARSLLQRNMFKRNVTLRKTCQNMDFLWTVFSSTRTENSAVISENMDQKKPVF